MPFAGNVPLRNSTGGSIGVLLSGREEFGPHYGGACARWTHEVYRRLKDRWKATVFGFPTRKEDLYPSLRHHAVRSSTLCKWIGEVPVLRRYEDVIWLRGLIRQVKDLDALHIHNRPQWAALLRDFGYRGKIILHLHNDHLGHWTTAMLDGLAPMLDRVAVCSTYMRDTFAPRSAALAAKAIVVFNGVDTQIFFPRPVMRDNYTILFVGRFDREKGVLELVGAYAELRPWLPQARLVIVGSTGFGTHRQTPYVRQVCDLAASVNNAGGRVEFAGYVAHGKELASYFQRAAVFVCPSLFEEPFGMVNGEAMACATPVAGAKRGGIPEVLGGCGVLVEPTDTKSFARTLVGLLADPNERMRLGQAGYERCLKEFDWNVTANNWSDLLEAVCAS